MIQKRLDDDTGLPENPIFSDFSQHLWMPTPRRRPPQANFSSPSATPNAKALHPETVTTKATPEGGK